MFLNTRFKILLLLVTVNSVCAQQSFDLFGNFPLTFNNKFRMNSLEANTANYNKVKDWELSLVMGYDFENNGEQNLELISVGKRYGKHYFYGRYTPGFVKEFHYTSGSVIVTADSSSIVTDLNNLLRYEEVFGAGYSYNYSDYISFGIAVRDFKQSFSSDNISPFFSDTLNYIGVETNTDNNNFVRADIGLKFQPYQNLMFELSSANLGIFKTTSDEINDFSMKLNRTFILRTEYLPIRDLRLFGVYESAGSVLLGGAYSTDLGSGSLGFAISAAHDYSSRQIVSSLTPALNYSNDLFSISLAGIVNFKSKQSYTLNDFVERPLDNLANNIYSGNRLLLAANFLLSFVPDKYIEIEDAQTLTEIFPAFTEEYKIKPVAKALVKNISKEPVSVQPVSYIIDFNSEEVYSPETNINKGETKEVYFYTVIPENKPKIQKRFISQIRLEVYTKNSGPDASVQLPILINDSNAWDGKVSHLKYFVFRNLSESQKIAKTVLNKLKKEIESADSRLSAFLSVKYLFNNFAEEILYVSDPRSVTDRVQFPEETFTLKGGDCDDLSTAFASLLESIGIQTAFVDYKSNEGISHVNLLINTKLKPEEAFLITRNDKKYIIRKNASGKDEIWIPLELTKLTDFTNAWNYAAEKFQKEAVENYGLSKGIVVINDIY